MLWGLLFDDTRLALTVIITLAVCGVLKLANATVGSPYVMVVGLLIALWISIEHQLRLKLKK